MTIIIILLAVALLIVLWIGATYNGFVVLKNRAKEAWSDIDVQLKRRHDLIPNLVETVKGYATHEKELFERVTKARAEAIGAKGVKEKADAENMLSNTLKSIIAISENYPDLKASGNFLELQRELSDTENKIQASRRFYNTNVRDLNIKVEKFPDAIIANMFGFKAMDLFEAQEQEREPVAVKF